MIEKYKEIEKQVEALESTIHLEKLSSLKNAAAVVLNLPFERRLWCKHLPPREANRLKCVMLPFFFPFFYFFFLHDTDWKLKGFPFSVTDRQEKSADIK